MANSTDIALIAQLLRLIFQAFFESLDASGLPGKRLKQQMLKNLHQRREDAASRGEAVEVYAFAEGAVASDPEIEDLLVRLFKKYSPTH